MAPPRKELEPENMVVDGRAPCYSLMQTAWYKSRLGTSQVEIGLLATSAKCHAE